MLKNIYNSLKSSGKLICEFGAYGNIAAIESGFADVLKDFSYSYHSKFNFSTVEEFDKLLKKNRFIVDKIYDYDRPTLLQDRERGLINWAKQFFAAELEEVPEHKHNDILTALESRVKDRLWNGQEWVADYRRLRVIAHIK